MVPNEKLLEVLGDNVMQDLAFAHANDVLKNAVGGISDIIYIPGLVNVDLEDVKTVMSAHGLGVMGTATAGGPDRATKAADAAVACPLLEGIDLSGARRPLRTTRVRAVCWCRSRPARTASSWPRAATR